MQQNCIYVTYKINVFGMEVANQQQIIHNNLKDPTVECENNLITFLIMSPLRMVI